ncbi:Two-component response regulator [Granulibacter bethesdensis]|nr:Two-component response regulator [Granulibacter bethesdensis]
MIRMQSLSRDELLQALPYARRYARALAGNQEKGDALVASSLRQALTAAESRYPQDNARFALYHWVTQQFSAEAPSDHGPLSIQQRQSLLLSHLEEVPVEAIGPIMALSKDQAASLLADARSNLRNAASANVLIIEDEPIIAMDIEELVQSCGHHVVGLAASEQEAVEMALKHRPGLILADINLGKGGDGMQAVSRILEHHQAPVIFVTAYPERLLTGEHTEPAFVITKPFEPMTLAITTYQAVTGGVSLG